MKALNVNQLRVLSFTAQQAAREAGQYIQSQFNNFQYSQHLKGDELMASTVVTEVDFKAQEMIITHLNDSIEKYDLGLLTEETDDNHSRLEKDFFWCIDPLDGTLPFVTHQSGYAVSIALVAKSGDPVIGVVYIPDTKVCFSGVKGHGVTRNGQLIDRDEIEDDGTVHFFMDRSFTKSPFLSYVIEELDDLIADIGEEDGVKQISYHEHFGAVRNALGTMMSHRSCYFKFPKKTKGGGSIWDFAATRLFFEELGLFVSTAQGNTLHLNNPSTTYMNEDGVLFATDKELSGLVKKMAEMVKDEDIEE